MTMEEAKVIAKENVLNRPATAGRLAGKIAIVTGAAQGFRVGGVKLRSVVDHGEVPAGLGVEDQGGVGGVDCEYAQHRQKNVHHNSISSLWVPGS